MSKSPEELQEEWLSKNKPTVGKCASFCFPLEVDKQRSMKSTYENNPQRLISTTAKKKITRKNRKIDDDALSNISSIGIEPHKFINKKVKLNSGIKILIQKEKLFMVPSTKRIFSKFFCSDGVWRTEKVLERLFNGYTYRPSESVKVNKPKKDLQQNELFDIELEEEIGEIGKDEKEAIWNGFKISDLRKKIISEEICPEFDQWKNKIEIEYKRDSISEWEETLKYCGYYEKKEAQENLEFLYSNRSRIINNNSYKYNQEGLNIIPGIFISNYRLPPLYVHDLIEYVKIKGRFGKFIKVTEDIKPSILKIMNDTFVFPEQKEAIDSEEYDFIISVIKSKIKGEDVFIEFKSFPHFLFDFSLNVPILVDKETGELYRYNMKMESYIMNLLEKDATTGNYLVYDKKTVINKGSSGIREIKKNKELNLKKEKELEELKNNFNKYKIYINQKFGYLKLVSINEDLENKKLIFNCSPTCHEHDGSDENLVKLSFNQWYSKRDHTKCSSCNNISKKIEKVKILNEKIIRLKNDYGIIVDNEKDYNRQMFLIRNEEAKALKKKEQAENAAKYAQEKRDKEKREKELQKAKDKELKRREDYKLKYENKIELYKSMISGYLKLNNAAWVSTNNVYKFILISIYKNEVWEFDARTKQMQIQKVIDYDILKKLKRIIDFYKTGNCIFYQGENK